MNILHIAYISNNKANGVSVVVPKYVEEQAKYEDLALLNLSNYSISEEYENAKIFNIPNANSIKLLDEPFNNPDLVIFHEVYRYPYIKIYKELNEKKIPYIIIPHGSLNKKVQRKNIIKKKIGNIVFFKRFVKYANKVQFLSNREKSMSIKYNKNSYVLGNGICINENIKKIKKDREIFKYIYIGRFDIKVKDIRIKAFKNGKTTAILDNEEDIKKLKALM